MEPGATVPRAYILPRGANSDVVQSVVLALSITPICCAVIFDANDSHLAHEFTDTVVRTETERYAIDFALHAFEQTQMPSLIIGNYKTIMAIHEDGRLEEMKWPVHDSTIN